MDVIVEVGFVCMSLLSGVCMSVLLRWGLCVHRCC